MERLTAINEQLYKLYGRVYNNKQFLTKKQYSYLTSCLFDQYVVEYKKFYLEKRIEDKQIIFNKKQNGKCRIPHKFLFFKNKVARLYINIIKKEVEEYFNSLNKNIQSDKTEE